MTTDDRVEMMRLADDIEHAEIGDLDQHQSQVVTRALRLAAALPAAQAVPGWQLVPIEPTEAMLDRALDEAGERIEPHTAERESGVAVECDISEEDAAEFNTETKAAHARSYRTMLAAAPVFIAEQHEVKS